MGDRSHHVPHVPKSFQNKFEFGVVIGPTAFSNMTQDVLSSSLDMLKCGRITRKVSVLRKVVHFRTELVFLPMYLLALVHDILLKYCEWIESNECILGHPQREEQAAILFISRGVIGK